MGSEWVERKLGDILTLQRGFNLPVPSGVFSCPASPNNLNYPRSVSSLRATVSDLTASFSSAPLPPRRSYFFSLP